MSVQLKEFEQQIKKDIPLSSSLAFEFVSFEDDCLTIKAPYLPNKNDKETVFAGSQASLALLSGWSLATLYFKEEGVSMVAAVKTEMHYRKPIEKDFLLKASFDVDSDLQTISMHLQKKGKARANVNVELFEQGSNDLKATFSGSYFLAKA